MNKKQKIIVVLGFGGLLAYFLNKQSGPALISNLSISPIITDLARSIDNGVSIMTTGQTRGERNNNPGNIRPAGYTWQGQSGIDSGSMGSYLIFSTPEYGIRAISKDLLTKFGRGLNTVEKIITAYAPPSENPTASYIAAVSQSLGVMSFSTLNLRDVSTLTNFVYAIIKHENGRVIYTPAQIAEGVSMALNS